MTTQSDPTPVLRASESGQVQAVENGEVAAEREACLTLIAMTYCDINHSAEFNRGWVEALGTAAERIRERNPAVAMAGQELADRWG